MKYLFLALGILCSMWSIAQQKEPSYISAVAGFYNLENLFDTINDPKIDDEEFLPKSEKKYDTYAYWRKLNNMAKVIAGIGKDNNPDGLALLGVVEIENATVLKDLCATDSLKDRNYQYVHFQSPDARGIDVGLIYSPKYFTVIDAYPHKVTLPDLHPTRDILLVKGDLVGDTVFVLVNHWPSRRGGSNRFDLGNKEQAYNRNSRVVVDRVSGVSRQNGSELTDSDGLRSDGEELTRPARAAAAKACKFLVDSIQATNPNAKVLIMGDLNDDPTSPSVKDVIMAKSDIAEVQPKEIYNALGGFFKQGYGSLAFNGKWNLFDQLMFTQAFLDKKQLNGWFLYSAHIYARDFLINQKGDYKGYPKRSWVGNNWNNGYSDHLPVYSILLRALPE
jgi:Endonuclease/Exonuclease/phosphatase family